jgi:hypothetical protein
MRRKRCRNGAPLLPIGVARMRLFRAPASMSRFAACGPAPRLFCKTSPLEIRLERRPRRSPTKVRSCRQSRGVIRGARDRNDQSTQRGSLAMIQSLETHAENLSALIGAMRTVAAVLDKIPQSLISLAARIFPAAVFWMSEQTKGRRVSCDRQRDCVVSRRIRPSMDRSGPPQCSLHHPTVHRSDRARQNEHRRVGRARGAAWPPDHMA